MISIYFYFSLKSESIFVLCGSNCGSSQSSVLIGVVVSVKVTVEIVVVVLNLTGFDFKNISFS